MGRLLRIIASWVHRATGRGRDREARARELEELHRAENARAEEVARLRNAGGFRKETIHVVGPPTSTDGRAYVEDHLEYFDENAVQTSVDYREVRQCDCGALLGRENPILGMCRVCARVLCSKEGCAHRCERCGSMVCTRHIVKWGARVFCSNCRLRVYWLSFWGLLK
jgi:hypothetical protein